MFGIKRTPQTTGEHDGHDDDNEDATVCAAVVTHDIEDGAAPDSLRKALAQFGDSDVTAVHAEWLDGAADGFVLDSFLRDEYDYNLVHLSKDVVAEICKADSAPVVRGRRLIVLR